MVINSDDFYALIKYSKIWDIAIGDSIKKVVAILGEADEIEEYRTGIFYLHYSYIRFAVEQDVVKGIDILDNDVLEIYLEDVDSIFSFNLSLSKLITFFFDSGLKWKVEMQWSNSDFLILLVETNCKIFYDLYKERIYKIENYVS